MIKTAVLTLIFGVASAYAGAESIIINPDGTATKQNIVGVPDLQSQINELNNQIAMQTKYRDEQQAHVNEKTALIQSLKNQATALQGLIDQINAAKNP